MDDANEETQTGNTIGRTPAANAVGDAPAGNAVEATPAGNTAEAAPADAAGEVPADNAPGTSPPVDYVDHGKARFWVIGIAAVAFTIIVFLRSFSFGMLTAFTSTNIIAAHIILYWWSVCRFAKHKPKGAVRWTLFIVMLLTYLFYAVTFVDGDDAGHSYGILPLAYEYGLPPIPIEIQILDFKACGISALCSLVLLLSTIPPTKRLKQLFQERKQSCEKDAQIPWDKRRRTYIATICACAFIPAVLEALIIHWIWDNNFFFVAIGIFGGIIFANIKHKIPRDNVLFYVLCICVVVSEGFALRGSVDSWVGGVLSYLPAWGCIGIAILTIYFFLRRHREKYSLQSQ